LRISELGGLRVQDLDLFRGQVHVRQIVTDPGGYLQIGSPKTMAGERTVPTLTRGVAGRLAEQIARRHLRPDDLVFQGKRGGALRPSLFRQRVFKPAMQAGGLAEPLPTPHALRHTAVAHWIAAGVTDHYKIVR
jgi:integrase